MATRDESSFRRMCRAFPLRTGVFTLGPLVVAAAQLCNAVVHGLAIWPVVAVALLTCAFSVVVTRYHLAAFRRRQLTSGMA